ncbi:MAG TPA: 16S rRNA (uracil(1498)-N(3))-methyltransferase [Nitrospirota bacterium]|nr:16S rRNA (uracil(1498)-N(3))-methyltransferase [Nitrospirota bacterium]
MTRLPRFFISPDHVAGPIVTVSGDDVRHIATVLRIKAGGELLLCDGQGTEYRVKILHIDKSSIKTEIVNIATREIRSPRITLGQGLPKSHKMDLIVQKVTELDVAEIVPLVTERTIVKVRDDVKRITRWQKICREAAMQSDRIDIPYVHGVQSFHEYLSSLVPHSSALNLLPWEAGTKHIKYILRENGGVKKIVVLIGPEGGFSREEAELAAAKGFHLISLGPNILRTETAAIAVLSMLEYEYA